jgi:hypothetical protein
MGSGRKERAERRRATWTGGVAKISEMKQVDAVFWAGTSAEQRLRSIWSIVEDSLVLGGDHGPAQHSSFQFEDGDGAHEEIAGVDARSPSDNVFIRLS